MTRIFKLKIIYIYIYAFWKNIVSCYVSRAWLERLQRNFVSSVRSIDRDHTGISRRGIVQLVSRWNPGYFEVAARIGENRIAARARFEQDGSWLCVGNIETRFVIAKFVFSFWCVMEIAWDDV